MSDDIDFSKFSKKQLDEFALAGIRKIMKDGILDEWLLEVSLSMASMEKRLKKLEEKYE